MFGISSLDRSATLVQGMAERTGTDLGTPQAARQFRAMVLACSGCAEQDACARLQAAAQRLDAAPAYCRNADLMGG